MLSLEVDISHHLNDLILLLVLLLGHLTLGLISSCVSCMIGRLNLDDWAIVTVLRTQIGL